MSSTQTYFNRKKLKCCNFENHKTRKKNKTFNSASKLVSVEYSYFFKANDAQIQISNVQEFVSSVQQTRNDVLTHAPAIHSKRPDDKSPRQRCDSATDRAN